MGELKTAISSISELTMEPQVSKDHSIEPTTTTTRLGKTHTHTVSKHVLARHSTRFFKPDSVPSELLIEALNHAQRAPSNSNVQPWRVHVLQDAALKRVSDTILVAVNANQAPDIKPLPEEYMRYRSAMGHALYGEKGYNIPRGAKDDMEKARRRNYTFFDAPVGMIISMDSKLAAVDILSVGLYLQMLCLLLQERGLGSCIQVSISGYPNEIRKELGMPDHMQILCGLAVGYEDPEHSINQLKMSRDAWKENVTFVTD